MILPQISSSGESQYGILIPAGGLDSVLFSLRAMPSWASISRVMYAPMRQDLIAFDILIVHVVVGRSWPV